MVHKKYTYKNGKAYGPYAYENKRVGGKVVTSYIGKDIDADSGFGGRLFWIVLGLFFISAIVAGLYLFSYSNSVTGKVALDISLNYEIGEPMYGDLKFNIKEGELVPEDSDIVITYGGQSKTLKLKDFVNELTISGDYYAEGKGLAGSGYGFGVIGSKVTYPVLEFDMKVYSTETQSSGGDSTTTETIAGNTTPTETSVETTEETQTETTTPTSTETPVETSTETPVETTEEASTETETSTETPTEAPVEASAETPSEPADGGITGGVVSETEHTVSGTVFKYKDYSYNLEVGQNAGIVSGSVVNQETGESVPDGAISLSVSSGQVVVSTDYFKSEDGFGEDYLGDYALILRIDVSDLDLIAEEGSLAIELVSSGVVLASQEKTIAVSGVAEEQNETIEDNGLESILNETITNETLTNQTIPETNVTLPELNATELNETILNETLVLESLKDFGIVRIVSGESAKLNLSNYFLNAEGYEFIGENVSAEFSEDLVTLTSDSGFKGAKRGQFRAILGDESLLSNEFTILVGSGAVKISTSREKIVVGEKVKWSKNVSLDASENITVELPGNAENISVKMVDSGGIVNSDAIVRTITGQVTIDLDLKREPLLVRWWRSLIGSITGRVVDVGNETTVENRTVEVVLGDTGTDYIIEYETPAPESREENTSTGKTVTISGPDEVLYEDVIAFTEIPNTIPESEFGRIKVYWYNYDYEKIADVKSVSSVENSTMVEEVADVGTETTDETSADNLTASVSNELGETDNESSNNGTSITGNVVSSGEKENKDATDVASKVMQSSLPDYGNYNDNSYINVSNANTGDDAVVASKVMHQSDELGPTGLPGSSPGYGASPSSIAGNVIADVSIDGLENTPSPSEVIDNSSAIENETIILQPVEGQDYVRQEMPFDAYDLDLDGQIDYIEWVVPHLSEQTFEIVLYQNATLVTTGNITFEANDAFSHLTVSQAVPYDSLVGYWNFDRCVGTTTYDLTSNNNDGTLVNQANCGSGLYDNGLVLDGVSDVVSFGDNSAFKIPTKTLSFWAKPSSNSEGSLQMILSAGGANYYISFYATNFRFSYQNSTGNQRTQDMGAGSTIRNEWHHYTAITNVSGVTVNSTLYRDGAVVGSVTHTEGWYDTYGTAFRIGTYQGTNLELNGSIDEVMMFNTPLTQEQVTAIYQNSSARFKTAGVQTAKQFNITAGNDKVNLSVADFERNLDSDISARLGEWDVSKGYDISDEGLVGYWNFDSDYTDSSGNGNDGTAHTLANLNSGGVYNQSLALDGGYSNVTITTSGGAGLINTSGAVSAWFKSGPEPNIGYIFTHRTGSENNRIYLEVYNGGKFYCGFGDDFDIINSGVVVANDGKWHLGTITWNSTTGICYLDANNVGSYAYSLPALDGAVLFGSLLGTSLNGNIDEGMLFNRTLSAEEIKELYIKGRANFEYTEWQSLAEGNYTEFDISTATTNILPEFKLDSGATGFYTPILATGVGLSSGASGTISDTINPQVNLTYPLSGELYNSLSALNYTVSDLNLGSCWYSLNSGVVNTSVTCGLNVTGLTPTEGSNTWMVWVNDTDGNTNSSSVVFSYDSINPLVSFVGDTPSDGETINQDNFIINMSSSDTSEHYAFADDGSLVGWWRMDDVNGSSDPTDISRYSNNGSRKGDAVINLNAGRFGQGLQLDGTGDYVGVVDDDSLNFGTEEFSVGVWFKSDNTPDGTYILQKGGGGANTAGYGFFFSSNKLYFRLTNGSSQKSMSPPVSFFADGLWHFAFGTRNSLGHYLYMDGGSYASGTGSEHNVTGTSNLAIGRAGTVNGGYFNGSIDEVLIFNRSLSSTEILALYNATANQYYNNFTGLAAGTHSITGYAVDVAGNLNNTESLSVTVALDSQAPSINITYPLNTTYGTIISALNYTASDTNLQSCWYSVDLGVTNVSVACGLNVTGLTPTEGSNTWMVWANDSYANTNSSNVTFTSETGSSVTICRTLDLENTVYTLQNDITDSITATGSCLTIGANNVTLDMNGKNVSYAGGMGLGVSISGYNSSTIENGTVDGFTYGIYATGSLNTTLSNLNITGAGSIGVNLIGGSSNSNLVNLVVDDDATGISISSSSNNILTNITVNNNDVTGLYYENSNNNNITNLAYSGGNNGIVLISSSNNLFQESEDVSTLDFLLIGSTNNVILNMSYSTESVDGTSQLIRKGYYKAFVNDTLGVLVSGANVTAYNITNAYQFNLTTDETGYTQLGQVIDYINVGNIKTYYSPYTIYATNSSYPTTSHSFNASLGNNLEDVFTLNVDSCGVPTSGIWNLICADNCSFGENVNIPGNVNISNENGAGVVNISAVWNFTSTGQKIYVYPGCKVNVYPGGGFNGI